MEPESMELWRAILVASVILVPSLAFGAVVGAITKSVAERRSTLSDPDLRMADIKDQVEWNAGLAVFGSLIFFLVLIYPLADFFDTIFG